MTYINVIKPTTVKCIEVTKDSIWCLGNNKYGFKLWINNQTGNVCSNLTITPNIAGSGIVNGGFTTYNVPIGPSVIIGDFTDWAPANNPFCLKLICNHFPETCSTVYCLPLPGCP